MKFKVGDRVKFVESVGNLRKDLHGVPGIVVGIEGTIYEVKADPGYPSPDLGAPWRVNREDLLEHLMPKFANAMEALKWLEEE